MRCVVLRLAHQIEGGDFYPFMAERRSRPMPDAEAEALAARIKKDTNAANLQVFTEPYAE